MTPTTDAAREAAVAAYKKAEDTHKLTGNQTDLLRLIARSPADDDGWCRVSEIVCELFTSPRTPLPPAELFEFEKLADGGRARLTERGSVLVLYT